MTSSATVIKELFSLLTHWIDAIGIIIIIWGFTIAFKHFLIHEFQRLRGIQTYDSAHKIRQILGVYILLGLEFMIASDIIHSFVSRSLQELFYLAIIVAIRTVISFFLGKELEHVHYMANKTKQPRHKQAAAKHEKRKA